MHINTSFLQYCLVKLKIFRRQIGRGTIFNNFEKGQAQALLLMLYKQKNISLLLKKHLILPLLLLTMGCRGYTVLKIYLERFHIPFCLTLRTIPLATRQWESSMHGFVKPPCLDTISFLQHKFAGLVWDSALQISRMVFTFSVLRLPGSRLFCSSYFCCLFGESQFH